MKWQRPRGSNGIPNWLLVAVVILTLAGAAALFLRDNGRGASSPTNKKTPAAAESVLELPDDEANEDEDEGGARRRGEVGRDRVDTTASPSDGDETMSELASRPLPASFDNLRDASFRLSPAAIQLNEQSAAERRVRVDNISTTCAVAARGSSLLAERDILTRVATVLQRAGANVDEIAPSADGPCVDARTNTANNATTLLVLSLVMNQPARAIAGRPTTTATKADRALSSRLAAELAAQLDASPKPPAPKTEQRALQDQLARAGAIDAATNGAVSYVELGSSTSLDDEQRDEIAWKIVTALAARATATAR